VASLAASITECGLLHPITVSRLALKDVAVSETSKKYRSWAGHDRLLAAKSKGWKEIPALVLEGDESQLRIIAAQENLVRRKLTCLDESLLLSAWQNAYEQRYPLAKRGGDRRNRKETCKREYEWRGFGVHCTETGHKMENSG
jgi:ParB/RepB/Spo0J family partition protein